MNITKQEVIAHFGSAEKAASYFAISRQAIYQWPDGLIPRERQLELLLKFPEKFGECDTVCNAAVRHLGGAKVVGPMLWPDKTLDASSRLIRDCTNANRPERLNPEQILLILKKCRAADFHGLKHFIDAEAGYGRTAPLDPIDELAQAQREFVDSVQQLKRLGAQIERMSAPLRVAS